MGNLAGLAEEDAVEKVLGPGSMGKNSTAQGRMWLFFPGLSHQ